VVGVLRNAPTISSDLYFIGHGKSVWKIRTENPRGGRMAPDSYAGTPLQFLWICISLAMENPHGKSSWWAFCETPLQFLWICISWAMENPRGGRFAKRPYNFFGFAFHWPWKILVVGVLRNAPTISLDLHFMGDGKSSWWAFCETPLQFLWICISWAMENPRGGRFAKRPYNFSGFAFHWQWKILVENPRGGRMAIRPYNSIGSPDLHFIGHGKSAWKILVVGVLRNAPARVDFYLSLLIVHC
jgi:hypothetical protein